MSTLLCETVTGRSMAELIVARDAATAADMVELRLDGVADLDVTRALDERRRPVVVTCRPEWKGGVSTVRRRSASGLSWRVPHGRCGIRRCRVGGVHGVHQPAFTTWSGGTPPRIVCRHTTSEGVPSSLDTVSATCGYLAPMSSRWRSRRAR